MEIIKMEGVGRIKFLVNEGDEQVSPFIELMSVYVEPEKRRQGHGSHLIKMLREEAKRRGVNGIYVKVTRTNLEFKNFLRKNRLVPSKRQELFYGYSFSLLQRLRRKMKK